MLFRSINAYILALFVTYIVYYLKDHITAVLAGFELAESGSSTFGKVVTVVLFLLCWFKIFNNKNLLPASIKYLLVAWCVFVTISNLLCITELGQIFNVTFQQMLWPSILVYFYSEANELPVKLVNTVLSILFLLCCFFVYKETIYMREFGQYAEQLQVNEIYFVVLLFPWVMTFDGRIFGIIKYVLLAVGIYLVFFSFKRTAMLCLVLGILLYLFGLLKQGRMKGTQIALIISIMIGGYFLFDIVNDQSGGRITERIIATKTDKGSSRLDIYGRVFNAMDSFSIGDYLFGKGRGSIGKYTGGYSAHNEYLEVFFSWGLIALTIYILFLITILKNSKCVKRNNIPIYFMSLGIFLSMSITSHLVIYPYLFNILVSYWGYSLAKK